MKTGVFSIARTRCRKRNVLCFQFTVVFPSWMSIHLRGVWADQNRQTRQRSGGHPGEGAGGDNIHPIDCGDDKNMHSRAGWPVGCIAEKPISERVQRGRLRAVRGARSSKASDDPDRLRLVRALIDSVNEYIASFDPSSVQPSGTADHGELFRRWLFGVRTGLGRRRVRSRGGRWRDTIAWPFAARLARPKLTCRGRIWQMSVSRPVHTGVK